MQDSSAIAEMALSPPAPMASADVDTTIDRRQPVQAEYIPAQAPKNLSNKQSKRKASLVTSTLLALKRINWIPVVLGIFGILVIYASFIENSSTMLSVSLALAGISIVSVSILYFFITPSQLIDRDICDAMSLSDAELMSTLLEPLVGNSKGVYIPASLVGVTQVLIMTRDSEFSKIYTSSAASITGVNADNKSCLFLTPPGYGLLSYVRSLGASFTNEGLADEIKDVLVNGLELVPSVEVTRTADGMQIRVGGISDTPMCKAMRQKGKKVCDQIGCPLCSFISCMVVEGAGRPAMITDVKFDEKAIELTYKLM